MNAPEKKQSKGMFEKGCGAVCHSSDKKSTIYNVLNGKKIKRKTIDCLLNQQLITKRTKYVCEDCVQKVEGSCSSAIKSDINYGKKDNPKCKEINVTEIQDHMQSDIIDLYKDSQKCSLGNLIAYDAEAWLDQRPKCLVDLLRKLCGLDKKASTSVETLQIAKLVEIIYGCRNKNLILPLSFQENLLLYSMSRNKQLVGYNSRLCPAGSEKTISRWMTQQADSEVKYPEGLVRSVFDNEQVVGKTYRVKSDNKLPTSVITSHLYIVIDEKNQIQTEEKYSPNNWLFSKPTKAQEQVYLSMNNDLVTETFRESRNTLLCDRLRKVIDEVGDDDVVNLFISENEKCKHEKTCVDCGGANEKNSRKCTNCGGLLIFESLNYLKFQKKVYPYNHFKNVEETSNSFKVKTGEPDLLNPSSFQNISEILYNLAERAGVSQDDGQRKWLFLECDGGIYSVVEKLIFNVFVCSVCNEAVYGELAFQEHRCSILHDVALVHEFGWVLPMPGLLRLEMNACKAFFQLNWDIFMKDVCIQLGFKTPKAQDCARKCLDHHKTFKILEILYIAMVDELLVPFAQFCKASALEATLDQYWIWSQDVKNANYIYCQQMALTFLHAIMVFRVGCRRANPSYIIAGREKMSLLFFCRNHPRYQRIVAMNSYIEAMMPVGLKDLVLRSLTLSRTGHVGHYQGGDACLEEINKEAKSWISPVGVPTENDWVKTFRNLDALSEVKQKLLNSTTGLSNEQKSSSNECSIDLQEIAPVRALFRKYFQQPLDEILHSNLSGEIKLTAHLSNITAESEALRNKYYICFLSGEQPKLPLVYVTEEELFNSEMIENLSKNEIQKKIYQLLECFSDRERRIMEEVFIKTVKAKNKLDYIAFYYTLLEDSE